MKKIDVLMLLTSIMCMPLLADINQAPDSDYKENYTEHVHTKNCKCKKYRKHKTCKRQCKYHERCQAPHHVKKDS